MPFFKLYPLKQDLFYANKHKKSSLFCIFVKGMIHNYIYYEKVAFRKKIKLLNIFIFPSIAAALLKDPTIISKKVRNPISVQNAMPPESIPCAGAAPCAIPCAGILKRKPAPFF